MGKGSGGAGAIQTSTVNLPSYVIGTDGAGGEAKLYIDAMRNESERIFGGSNYWVSPAVTTNPNGPLDAFYPIGAYHGSFAFTNPATGKVYVGLGKSGYVGDCDWRAFTVGLSEYDPMTNTWVLKANVANGLVGDHEYLGEFCRATSNGFILVQSLCGYKGTRLLHYDVNTNLWRWSDMGGIGGGSLVNPPFATTNLIWPAMFDIGGEVYVFGGNNFTAPVGTTRTIWKYIPETIPGAGGTWYSLLFPDSVILTSVDVASPSVFVSGNTAYIQAANKLFSFQPTIGATSGLGGVWTALADMPATRFHAAATAPGGYTVNGAKKGYVVGGEEVNAFFATNGDDNPGIKGEIFIYDILTNTWTTGPSIPIPFKHGIAFHYVEPNGTEHIYAGMGRFNGGTGSVGGQANMRDIFEFKPSTPLTVSDTIKSLRTYALQDPDELTGLTNIANRVTTDSEFITKGNSAIRKILDSSVIATNTEADNAFNSIRDRLIRRFREDILPTLKINANQIGRFGGVSHHLAQIRAAREVLDELIKAANSIYYSAFQREKALQISAAQLGISYSVQSVKNAEILRWVGLLKREYDQGRLDDHYKRFHDAVERQTRGIEILGNAVRSIIGGHVVSTEPYFVPGRFAEAAGMALAGAGIFGLIYEPKPKNLITEEGVAINPPKK